jgi:hypothetical protein
MFLIFKTAKIWPTLLVTEEKLLRPQFVDVHAILAWVWSIGLLWRVRFKVTTSIFRTGSITSHGIMIQHQQGCYGCCAGPAIKCQRRACPQLRRPYPQPGPSDGHTEVIKEFFQENAVAGRRVEAGRPSTDVTGAISHFVCAQLSTVQNPWGFMIIWGYYMLLL